MPEVIAAAIAAVVASVLTFVAIKAVERLRKKDAEAQAKEIIERAERDAANRIKEAELETKERALAHQAIESEVRPRYPAQGQARDKGSR